MEITTAQQLLKEYQAGQREFNELQIFMAHYDEKALNDFDLSNQNLSDTIFIECDFSLDFSNCNLSNSVFKKCGLKTCTFDNADLTNAILEECSIDGASFTNAKVEGIVIKDIYSQGHTFQKDEFVQTFVN